MLIVWDTWRVQCWARKRHTRRLAAAVLSFQILNIIIFYFNNLHENSLNLNVDYCQLDKGAILKKIEEKWVVLANTFAFWPPLLTSEVKLEIWGTFCNSLATYAVFSINNWSPHIHTQRRKKAQQCFNLTCKAGKVQCQEAALQSIPVQCFVFGTHLWPQTRTWVSVWLYTVNYQLR